MSTCCDRQLPLLRFSNASIIRCVGNLRPDNDMNYHKIITIEPGKRGGRACIRGMRIAVADVLGWLAAGMSHAEIIDDFPELAEEDIRACLEYAADRERRLVTVTS
jgi:uncharacterized protein (DUF433 family)